MLHEPHDQFQPSKPETDIKREIFDAAAYVAEMRAAGVVVTPTRNGEKLSFMLTGPFGDAYFESAGRWGDAFARNPHAKYDVWNFLNEERRFAEAKAVIGDDVEKGLAEVRRLRAVTRVVYGEHNRLQQAHIAVHADSPEEEHIAAYHAWPGMDEAEAAADEVCDQHHHAILYVLKMPIRSVADAIAKTRFAIENADYAEDDEDFQRDVLQQLAEFLVPQQFAQAAE